MTIRKFADGLLATLTLGTQFLGGAAVVHAQRNDPIHIGANLELSVMAQPTVFKILDNLRMAADGINEAGGLLDGRLIEIVE